VPAFRGDLGVQGVERLIPHVAESLEPEVDRAKRLRLDRIQAACALGTDARKPVFSEDAQVLGDRGLRDPELRGDHLDHRSRCELAGGQQLEDATPHGIGEDLERVHQGFADRGL
jgi:hypothetical protein